MEVKNVRPADFDSLEIVTKDLTLVMYVGAKADFEPLLTSFFNRVAKLGHFERLNVSVRQTQEGHGSKQLGFKKASRAADALIHALQANQKLTCLNLGGTSRYCLDWEPHLKKIFTAMEDHSGLRSFLVYNYPKFDDPCYSWLWKLLIRNRNITVYNAFGFRCSDGYYIDQLYALNRFFCGSAKLMEDSTAASRPMLVAKALTDSASNNFGRIALLLSNHTIVLCNLLDSVDLDIIGAA